MTTEQYNLLEQLRVAVRLANLAMELADLMEGPVDGYDWRRIRAIREEIQQCREA